MPSKWTQWECFLKYNSSSYREGFLFGKGRKGTLITRTKISSFEYTFLRQCSSIWHFDQFSLWLRGKKIYRYCKEWWCILFDVSCISRLGCVASGFYLFYHEKVHGNDALLLFFKHYMALDLFVSPWNM